MGGSGGGSSGYTVGRTVGGLSGTLVLQNNGTDDKTITSNGTYAFATQLADGALYDITVKGNPAGQVCAVKNNAGTIAGANANNVNVECASDTNWI